MSTAKKRINLTVDDEVFEAIGKIAKKEKTPLTSVIHLLLEKALQSKEDFYFTLVGEQRLVKTDKRVKHEDIWD